MREVETPRLVIRAFTAHDAGAFVRLMAASFPCTGDARAHQERLAFYHLGETVLARLRQPPYGDRAMVLKATGRLVGSVGLVPCLAPFDQLPIFGAVEHARYRPEVGLFYTVSPEHRGRGFASEAAAALARFAFDDLHVQRVVATTEYDNAASAAVMRRIGMTVQRNPQPTPPWFQVVGILHA